MEDWEVEWALFKKVVRREKAAARKKGLAWTKPRRFINSVEMMGKLRCNPLPRPRKCKRRATHVSYSIFLHGCVVFCDYCVSRRASQ